MPRLSRRSISLVFVLSCLLTTLRTHANDTTTIVLHAQDGVFAPCAPVPFDCGTVRPTIDATGFAQGALVFVCLHNYTDVVAFQCAFDEAPSRDGPRTNWILAFGNWDCQVGQVNGSEPSMPLGPRDGTITTAFNLITGGTLEVVGRMTFLPAPAAGCLEVVASSRPFGNVIVNRFNDMVPLRPLDWGRICVGPGGADTCYPILPAVEANTWGAIKAQYH
jgi:hypothetical protein